jgi:hypothetical protein
MEFPIDEKCEICMRGVESPLPTEDDDGLKEQMINIEHPYGGTKPRDPWTKKSNPTKMEYLNWNNWTRGIDPR